MAVGNRTVKIVVSRREARQIMDGRWGALSDRKLHDKLRKAVLRAFTDYAKELKVEIQADNIVMAAHRSDEMKAIMAKTREARRPIDEQHHKLNRDEAEAVENLVNSKLDEAGITSYRARGFGFRLMPKLEDNYDQKRL